MESSGLELWPPRRRLANFAGAVLLLSAALLAPTPARAGCGDGYVHRRPTANPQAPAPVPELPPVPCHGPGCSGNEPPPLLPAPVTPPAAELWACLGGADDGGPAPVGRPNPGEPSRKPTRLPGSVFRPPRPL